MLMLVKPCERQRPLRVDAATRYARWMLSVVLSTAVFFVASFFIRRHLEGMGIPKGMTRATVVFTLALVVAYGVAFLANRSWSG